MENKALVGIDLQNDITKNYKLIIERVNAAIDWATENDMHIIYVKHYNLTEMYEYYTEKGCDVLTFAECK